MGFSQLHWMAFEADVLPHTPVNVGESYYHDHPFDASTSTFLAQLHLYL